MKSGATARKHLTQERGGGSEEEGQEGTGRLQNGGEAGVGIRGREAEGVQEEEGEGGGTRRSSQTYLHRVEIRASLVI